MWYSFWLKNLHFGLEFFVALAAFATAWLLLDSYLLKKETKGIIRALGFFFLAFWAGFGAIQLETDFSLWIEWLLKVVGLILILISFVFDPVAKKPVAEKKQLAILPIFASVIFFPQVLSTILVGFVTYSFFVRYSKGLIRELKPLVLAFLLFTVSELITCAYIFRGTDNVTLFNLLQPHGVVWIVEHLLKFAGFVYLMKWTWGYIRFRLVPQLFIINLSAFVVIFLITTFAFTTLLLKSVEKNALAHLSTDLKTLRYAVTRLENEAMISAKIASESGEVKSAIVEGSADKLFDAVNKILLDNKIDTLWVTNNAAEVQIRAEDQDRKGDSLSNNPVIWRALDGKDTVSILAEEGNVSPIVSLQGAVPLKIGGEIQGAVIAGFILDNAFVDGIKDVTDLDVTVFGAKTRSATTFIADDEKSRFIGIEEGNKKVTELVLKDGESYIGSTKILNKPYFAAYAPLKDVDNTTIGMLFVGQEQVELLAAAEYAIKLTFLIAALLLLLSIFPAWRIAKYIAANLRV